MRSSRGPLCCTRSIAVRVAGATTPSVAMVPSKSHARTRNRTAPLCQSREPSRLPGERGAPIGLSPIGSVLEADPDFGALADLRPDLDTALLQLRARAHGDHAEMLAGIRPPLRGTDIEAHAVVAHERRDRMRLEGDHDLDALGPGMLPGVVHRLLDDPEERGLQRTGEPRLLPDHTQAGGQPVDLVVLGELAECGH